ncbi:MULTISPECIES: HlyD family type I secretion periplasmic adaptor subunit [Sphingomonas]|uniref:Membrane fusion protein (MFP) family protein n=1 Tax=Sphingomonas adhaesiva TaxID=28212 RepID=A0A2A4I6Z1_9SPHN|nr:MULTISPECIES: HlyD family type I secretion periplasmic adaptor subunit [Sphingomonas]PCG14757.1 HlyD family type I secretion periplasmic adaptor subunit [Sphingomonas adhaesiva]PZU81618.1 MAG: HlyD family type I secretion periplasmic adaptor subunit [Sphingomonas sp.]
MSMSATFDRFALPDGDRTAIHDPRRELRWGAALAGLLVLGFGGWAVATRLDAAVVSGGVVRLTDARQVVQAPAAGIISSLDVRNGMRVRAGQQLVAFTASEALAQERSLAARTFGLQAEIARIETELRGGSRVAMPATLGASSDADRALAAAALASEQAQLDAQRALEGAQAAVLRDRRVQVGHQIDGYRQRLGSTQRQRALNASELDAYRGLLARGLATRERVLNLERSAAALDGDQGETVAEMARLRNQAGEAQLQLTQLRSERANQNAERLRTAQNDLAAVLPQWQAARDQLRRTVVRAPFAGTVTALQPAMAGSVVPAGARLLELVPARDAIVVEAKVSATDAMELTQGQAAEVRAAGSRGRLAPPLHGTVERVSADSIEDERTGQVFYTAAIRLAPAEVQRMRRDGTAGALRAGTPVEVMIPTKARSALDYLVGPLLARLSKTFAEQ